MEKITFEEIAIRMTELNDPREGEMNIENSRRALILALTALAEAGQIAAISFISAEVTRIRGVVHKAEEEARK